MLKHGDLVEYRPQDIDGGDFAGTQGIFLEHAENLSIILYCYPSTGERVVGHWLTSRVNKLAGNILPILLRLLI